jgi:glycosyltransferase involved in cell wall biosynthesis
MVPVVSRLLAQGRRFDAIDAHYVYPDGVAAVWLGRRFGLPVVMTARGTDVNLIPRYAGPRRLIRGAIRECAAMIAVSGALKQALIGLGAPDGKVTVLRNGVETDLFRPVPDREAARAALGVSGKVLISVGGLIERKGHHRTIEAMRALPGEYSLLIVGEGPERARLERAAAGIDVRFVGRQEPAEVAACLAASDVVLFPTQHREAAPLVLLQAMACGRPVIASRIGAVPEVVRSPEEGVLVEPRDQASLVRELRLLLDDPERRERMGRSARARVLESFTVERMARDTVAVYDRALAAA